MFLRAFGADRFSPTIFFGASKTSAPPEGGGGEGWGGGQPAPPLSAPKRLGTRRVDRGPLHPHPPCAPPEAPPGTRTEP